MENGNNWVVADLSRAEGFSELGQREQNAVSIALSGIEKWQKTKIAPVPMKVTISPDKPFNMRAFANVLHKLQIGITEITRDEESGGVTFQPKPYSSTFSENSGSHSRTREEILAETFAGMPPELRDFFSKYL